MNIGEVFKTKRWKTFMGYIYGWGASVVMIGALFKLEHFQYSGLLLTIGLMTEAFIFFLSAFEPPLELPEWGKVYPELREDYEMVEMEDLGRKNKKGLDELFSNSKLTPDLLDKVGKGLNELSNTARGISDISSATLATDMYVKNLGSASESMSSLATINNRANESISKMQSSSQEFSSKLDESGNKLINSFHEASNSISKGFSNIGETSSKYSTSLENLNRNVDELNKTFVAQLSGSKVQFEASQKFNKDLSQMNSILTSSVDELKKYKENAEQLNKNLEALNTIYGNMLGAMSYKK